MDISGLNAAFGEYSKQISGNNAAEQFKNKVSNKDYANATDEELMKACKEFEAYFVELMFKEMMKTVPESELSSGANTTLVNYYKDELVKDVAKQSVGQSNFGLAQTLYEQMKRNYEV